MRVSNVRAALASSCVGKPAKQKRFSFTYYREAYERNIARVHSKEGGYMKAKRQSTVEPVFGTLTQCMGLRKINTIGIRQANKVMHMAAIGYNLKKYLKFILKNVKIWIKAIDSLWSILTAFFRPQIRPIQLI